MADSTIDIIVTSINGKITVLYDNESDRLSNILNIINDNIMDDNKAYIKTVDKKKYLSFKDNAVSLESLIS